ncbi:hypothetical protein KS4_23680 [Poriferisphaera corsica]|uniref:Uncharacterized protein n=1 Tax=Poriferisphaera corsica TaxID=2528020 RepID=A0A517YVP1_9BACT|nr:hypothetical protein [Poriferisphaera corsica]QDU34301.1 hypothetical protein KS4_23680 [Poriferisphaera corsica]
MSTPKEKIDGAGIICRPRGEGKRRKRGYNKWFRMLAKRDPENAPTKRICKGWEA